MFGTNYRTPKAAAYRRSMIVHYVPCDICLGDVCGDYAVGKDFCRFNHDDCAGGGLYDDGVFCHYCR
jgi:hypothetical protein